MPQYQQRVLCLKEFDCCMRSTLSSILNVHLDDPAWMQTRLPKSSGSLGIRSAVALADPAFLSSVHGADALFSRILSGVSLVAQDPLLVVAMQHWKSSFAADAGSITLPSGDLSRQKHGIAPLLVSLSSHLVLHRTTTLELGCWPCPLRMLVIG